jgi:hypothetical protein
MPAEILNGTATLNGIQNSGSAITITGYATFILNTLSPAHQFDLEDVKDEQGFDTSTLARNQHYEATMDFTPSAGTRVNAAALATFPTPLSAVAIDNCLVQLCNGTWIYRGGAKIDQSAGQVVKVTGMTIRRYADSSQNSSLATTVSG